MWAGIDAMRPIMGWEGVVWQLGWALDMVGNRCPYSSPWDMAVGDRLDIPCRDHLEMPPLTVLAWEADNSVNTAKGRMVEGFLLRPVPLVRNHLVSRACTVPVVVVRP